MPAAILLFSEDPPMTVRDSQFSQLQERVNAALERIARLEGASPSTANARTSHLTLIVSALAIVVTVVITGIAATHIVDSEVASKYDALDTRLTKAEGAIKALASQQSEQNQKLVQSLLAAAKTSTPDVAERAATAATSLMEALKAQKAPASPQFFENAFANLNAVNPAVTPTAFQAKLALAEYRSSLLSIQVPASALHCSGEAARKESKFPDNASFRDLTFDGCVIALDDKQWNDVAFVNAHIIYRGGALYLNHVIFANCTFELQPTAKHASQLLEYAGLDEKELSAGS